MAEQTEDSLKAVLNERPETRPQFDDIYPLDIDEGWLGIEQVVRLNQITVANAERYVYADRNDEKVLLLLNDLFFGQSEPVRRFDRQGAPLFL
jgi:hypothetical protein